MPNNIALMGVSGAGKDYIADYLVNNHCFTRFSFSDQLKRLANQIYPWLNLDYPPIVKEEPLNITLESGEKITKSPREIWLHLNSLRDIEKDIFIRMLAEEIRSIREAGRVDNILISDIRSSDELEWCKSSNFSVIYIKHKKQIYKEYEIDSHISKNAHLADYTFINNFNGEAEIKDFFLTNFNL